MGMYGQQESAPKRPARKMMDTGDLGSPGDMDTPQPPSGAADGDDGKATLQSISDKLDAIMEALQIPQPGDAPPDEGAPPMPGGPTMPPGAGQ